MAKSHVSKTNLGMMLSAEEGFKTKLKDTPYDCFYVKNNGLWDIYIGRPGEKKRSYVDKGVSQDQAIKALALYLATGVQMKKLTKKAIIEHFQYCLKLNKTL